MTPEGEKWVRKVVEEAGPYPTLLLEDQAELWVRAFVEEVERRANEGHVWTTGEFDIGRAFYEMKREFFGGENDT